MKKIFKFFKEMTILIFLGTNMLLFILLLILSFTDAPREIQLGSGWQRYRQIAEMDYSVSGAFLATSKNTVASWFGMSIDLKKSNYIYANNERGYYPINLMKFASILPYLMGVLFLFSLFKYFSQRKKIKNE